MKTVRFEYDGERGIGYRCSEPGDNDGEYVKVEDAKARYDAHRKRCEQECTRDVIFLFQVRRWQRTGDIDGLESGDCGEFFTVINWPKREPMYGPTPPWKKWPEECDEVPEWVRKHVDGDGIVSLTQKFYLEAATHEADNGWPLAYAEWRTESVWLDREEAEAFGKSKSYRWPDGWRVYGVCAEGDLAKMLRGEA